MPVALAAYMPSTGSQACKRMSSKAGEASLLEKLAHERQEHRKSLLLEELQEGQKDTGKGNRRGRHAFRQKTLENAFACRSDYTAVKPLNIKAIDRKNTMLGRGRKTTQGIAMP